MRHYKHMVPKWQLNAALITLGLVVIAALFRIGVLAFNPVFISPYVEYQTIKVKEIVEVEKENADTWIDRYARLYTDSDAKAEYLKYQLHCLYWKESRNGLSNDHGDSGKAGGPYQFWEATYKRMRARMQADGLVNWVGSRYDTKDAIQTTAWALSNGYAKEWGPVVRGECN